MLGSTSDELQQKYGGAPAPPHGPGEGCGGGGGSGRGVPHGGGTGSSASHELPTIYNPCHSVTNMAEFNNNSTTCSGGGSDVESGEAASACAGCGGRISERYFLAAAEKQWHMDCLRCVECKVKLDSELTCFSRDADIYCREDYYRKFAVKTCARCQLPISSDELVMRARDHVYHVTCFACASCHKILSTGEQFGMRDHLIFCKIHYDSDGNDPHCGMGEFSPPPPHLPPTPTTHLLDHMMGGNHPGGGMGGGLLAAGLSGYFPPPGVAPPHKGRPRKRKNQNALQDGDIFSHGLDEFGPDGYPLHQPRQKRIRTSFKHHQLRILKSYFALNQNPDAKDLKQLAQKTGLTKRVLQVWFQNARAKYRRNLLKQEQGSGGNNISSQRHDSSGNMTSPGNASDQSETSFSELHDDLSQSPRPLQNGDLSGNSSLMDISHGPGYSELDLEMLAAPPTSGSGGHFGKNRGFSLHEHHRDVSHSGLSGYASLTPSSVGNVINGDNRSNHQGSTLSELFSSTISAIH